MNNATQAPNQAASSGAELDDAIAEIGAMCQGIADPEDPQYVALQTAMKRIRNLKRRASTQPAGAGELADDADAKYAVIVDRRDLFDYLRAAWREGSSVGLVDGAESWHKATDYAEGALKGWSTMRTAVATQPTVHAAAGAPAQAQPDERALFEAKIRELSNGEPDFSSPAAMWAWAAWQARAALSASPSAPVGYMRLLKDGTKMGLSFDKLEEPLIEGWLQVPVFLEPSAPSVQAEPVAQVVAGKYAARLEWLSDEAMQSVAPGTKLYTGAAPATNPMCERKTNHIMQREGYEKTGYVLKKAGERICVSDGGAVAWFTAEQWNWLMFNRDHVEFAWPKPIGAAPAEQATQQQVGEYETKLEQQVGALQRENDDLRTLLNIERARYFTEHGVLHDRVTGQHLWTQDQYDEAVRNARADGPAINTSASQKSIIGVWNDALEEAALICDRVNNHDDPLTASDCAGYIRELKSAAPLEAHACAVDAKTQAARDVLDERRRQIEQEGWTPEHDDEHARGELSYAAAAYAVEVGHLLSGMLPDASREPPFCWPWDKKWWKSRSVRQNLVKAGALVLAEIERLDRAASQQAPAPITDEKGSA